MCTITDLVPLPGQDRLVVGAADPQLLLLDAQGQAQARQGGNGIAYMRGQREFLACAYIGRPSTPVLRPA